MTSRTRNGTLQKPETAEPRQPEVLSGDDLVADLIQTTDDNGQVRFRQTSAINKYNRKGITLSSVAFQLDYHYSDELIALATAEEQSSDDAGKKEIDAPLFAPAYLIRSRDKTIVNIIQKSPIAIVASAECRDAVVRWCYSAWYARSSEAREHGTKMLKLIQPGKIGRPERIIIKAASLKAAYEDLMEYGKGIRKCCTAVKTIDDLLKFFPDCLLLESLGITVKDCFTKNVKLPAPHQIATSYLCHLTQLRRSRLLKLVES